MVMQVQYLNNMLWRLQDSSEYTKQNTTSFNDNNYLKLLILRQFKSPSLRREGEGVNKNKIK